MSLGLLLTKTIAAVSAVYHYACQLQYLDLPEPKPVYHLHHHLPWLQTRLCLAVLLSSS